MHLGYAYRMCEAHNDAQTVGALDIKLQRFTLVEYTSFCQLKQNMAQLINTHELILFDEFLNFSLIITDTIRDELKK